MKKEQIIDDKKNIKRQRVKMYFLEATKELIINEGVESVSVRKVADIAGYSYATIYNYFEDINELLWKVRSLIMNDIASYMQKKINEPLNDLEGIKKLFKIYISYYFENPNVFKFFYFHQLSKRDDSAVITEAEPNFEEIWKETLKGFVEDSTLQEKDIQVVSKIFIYAMHGMIAISLSDNDGLTEENVYRDLENIVDYILLKK
jgi:AcrR family transcriptional regulator